MILLDQGGAGRAHASLIAPPERLHALVEHAFIQRPVTGRRHAAWRVVPDGQATIIVAIPTNGSSGPRVRCTIVGPRSRYGDIDMSRRRLTCGIRLQPGALPAITGLAANALTDRSITLESLGGFSAATLRRRLQHATRVADVIDALFAFVAESARDRRPWYDHALFRGARHVTELARRLRAPERTAYQQVIAHVGLSPKRLLRVERLHRALEERARGATWSQAAQIGGYADQPHLVREARSLLGETPEAWRQRAASHD